MRIDHYNNDLSFWTVKWDCASSASAPGKLRFTITPKSGYSWNSSFTSSSGIRYYQGSTTGNYYPNSTSNFGYGTVTLNRSGNTITDSTAKNYGAMDIDNYFYVGSNKYYIFLLDISSWNTSNALKATTFTPTISMSSYIYGGTKSTPSVGNNQSGGTATYYYNTSNSNSGGTNWTKVTSSTYLAPGLYYMYVLVAATGSYSEGRSSTTSFYVYVPTPTLSTTSYPWINAQRTVSPSYNSSYINTPSGTTGTNIGSYTITFTTNSTSRYFSNGTRNYTINWSIVKASVTLPTVTLASPTYNGSRKTPTTNLSTMNTNATYVEIVTTGEGYTYATNAGTYTITFRLKNTTNSQWSDGTIANKPITWTINRSNTLTRTALSDSGKYTYNGGTITVNVNSTANLTITGNTGENAGSYTAKFTPTSNYAWTDGGTDTISISWTILQRNISNVTVSLDYSSYVYDGTVKTPTPSVSDDL